MDSRQVLPTRLTTSLKEISFMKGSPWIFAATALVAGALTLGAPAHAALAPLPADGSQVNNDPANSIDPNQDAGVSDVTGGAVTAGNLEVPWATFEQRAGSSQQIFVRAFKNGAWVTQGFPASLNIDPTKEAEAPAIDFAGTGRTVPWVTWYEPNDAFGSPTNIFASRFNAGANVWLSSGQDRTAGGLIASLNIHTDRTAENPSVAGGATVAGNDPVPWVVWEENDGGATDTTAPRQIFVSKAVKQAMPGTPCAGFKPAGGNNVNGFCWQQVGLERLDPVSLTPSVSGDPTLNIDPTRNGVEPDIAFTGTNDTVAWAVWYEEDTTGLPGLRNNQQVFAAKIVADATADGAFHWQAVGSGTAGLTQVLDTSGATHGFGPCAESQAAEDACSLNKVPGNDAENPRVAAGTLTPGGTTVPWVVWEEDVGGGTHAIFVSRLVNSNHFELFNGGQPISNTVNSATRPDITFSGNVPYISWQEQVGSQLLAFVGHFEGGAASPVFRLDTPGGIASSAFTDVANALRPPISSTCTSNPTNADGSACQAGAAGTPFFLFTAGAPGLQKLFADAFVPVDVTTLAATDVTSSGATLHGSANPGGASTKVHFEFGPTTAYGSSTNARLLGAGVVPASFDATLTSLDEGATLHFRAVAQSDFVTVDGADLTLDVVNLPPAFSLGDLSAKVHLRKLGRTRVLDVPVQLSEPATVTIELLRGRRKIKVVRQVTAQAPAGASVIPFSLKHVGTGRFSLRLVATDADGAASAPVVVQVRLKR
jgi:hypothetical protein